MEALGSTIDHDRDSVVEFSGDATNQSGDEPDSSIDLQEIAADSSPQSVTGDCLMCSDTKEVAVNLAHKKF